MTGSVDITRHWEERGGGRRRGSYWSKRTFQSPKTITISGLGRKSGHGSCAMDKELYLRVSIWQSRGEHVLLWDQTSRQYSGRARHWRLVQRALLMADVRGLRRGLQLHSGITCLIITPLMHINITLNELLNIGLDTCFSSFGQRPREWAVPYRSVLSWRCRRSSFPAPGSSTVCTTQSKRLFPTLTHLWIHEKTRV